MTTKKTSQKTCKPVRENRSRLSRLIEQNLENVEIVLGVRGAIVDKLQGMAEDLAKIEPDDLMPMADSLKTAFGPDVASRFSTAVTGKLRELVTSITAAKDAISGEISRLESAANGEPANDMGMDDDEMPAGDEGEMPTGDEGIGDESDQGNEMPADDMGDQGETDLNELPPLGDDEKMNAAGRAKKEGAVRRGRRLVEFASANFDANLHSLSGFDPRAGTIALSIHDMIDGGRFDGEERKGLASVLNHIAAFAADARHWEDPDAKVEAALASAHVDTRLPEVRGIVAKLKKLAHMISLKHDGMMESKKLANNIKTLREAKTPDALVLREFRRVLSETKNPVRAAKMVAESFAIEASDVVEIIREAKKESKKVDEAFGDEREGNEMARKSDAEKWARQALEAAGIYGRVFLGKITVNSEEDKKKARAAGITLPIVVENSLPPSDPKAAKKMNDEKWAREKARDEADKKKEDLKKKSSEIVKEFDMKPTPKSKRGMFKGVSQADLQKRLTAAKHSMKAKEDKGEKVPHELRSKVSELEFALRAKHKWGKVKESNDRWMDVIESDLPSNETSDKSKKGLEEQVPLKPKTPADLRADRAAQAQQQPQGNGQKAPQRSVTQQEPNAQGFAPFRKGAQGQPQATQQKPQQPQQAAGQGQAPMVPSTMKQPIPVGSAPKKEPEMPKMPGKEMKSVPGMDNDIPPVTLMSKPTPFPKPGAQLMNTGGQQTQVSEKRTRR